MLLVADLITTGLICRMFFVMEAEREAERREAAKLDIYATKPNFQEADLVERTLYVSNLGYDITANAILLFFNQFVRMCSLTEHKKLPADSEEGERETS